MPRCIACSTVGGMAWTYILQCSDGSYYVGSTFDLERRLSEHNLGLGAAYTRRRRPVTLAWCAEFESIEDAFLLEKRVQGWGRRKREALMRGDFDLLPLLASRSTEKRAEADRRLRNVDVATDLRKRTDVEE